MNILFDATDITLELEKNIDLFTRLLSDTTAQVTYFKPTPEKWNLLEVACHLLDEEREDFRPRLQHILDQNTGEMPPINPPLWVTERNYAAQHLPDVLSVWCTERQRSVQWLRSLGEVDWQLFYTHPKLGRMTAKLFLSNWLAHDYLHVRQIIGLKFAYLQQQTGEDLSYAGSW
jgi:hypothetical protein